MDTPRFVARRVGDDYEIVPESVMSAESERLASSGLPLAGGALLAGAGLARGGLLGNLMLLSGGGLVYYGVTGRNPLDELYSLLNQATGESHPQGGRGGSGPPRANVGPSFQHDAHAHSTQQPEDSIDEAAMESFPASDPPAH